MESQKRDSFGSKFGFVLACIGSAVGVGNLWLFPWRVGQYGGAAFLIPYIIFIIILGYTGLVGEFSFGRWAQTGPIGAFEKALTANGKNGTVGKILGVIPVIGILGIAIGYSVVVGWILRFLVGSITGSMLAAENSGAYFGAIAGPLSSVKWHIVSIVVVALIMCAGVSKGIEVVNKIMMPLFFFLFIILVIRSNTLPGSKAGLTYLLIPKWELLLNPKTWVYALGQAFFSISLAGNGMLVYGSYLKKDVDIPSAAISTAIFDTIAALLAAFVIIPAVFAFGINPSAGPPLLFITLPAVFKQMPMGHLFAVIFFLSVFFAAITSIINLFEPPIEALQNKFKLARVPSVIIVSVITFLCALPVENGDLLGKWMDFFSIYIIPFGAMLAAVFFYIVFGFDKAKEQIETGAKKKLPHSFKILAYAFVFVTVIVFILGIMFGGIG